MNSTGQTGYRVGWWVVLLAIWLVAAGNAGAEPYVVAPRTPLHTPIGGQPPSPMGRVQGQVQNQQRQQQQELLERSRVSPPPQTQPQLQSQPQAPVRTDLPMSPQSQSLRCQRQLNEIQTEERGQLSGDCRIWRREQFRPSLEH